ncbi:MAG: twin-arginine translocation signal domain-containing protein [Burkholderiales bacterium]
MGTTYQSSRRSFLKAGLAGAIVLAAAGGLYRTLNKTSPYKPFALDGEARSALGAIVGVMLQSAIPASSNATEQAISNVLKTIAELPLSTQKEIQDMFGLLTLAPVRRFLVGIPDDWSKAKDEDIAAFLQSWRLHRIMMLQSIYHALHDLIFGGWYGDESTWASIGYPGPIKELS